ncbi:MAG: hypothetical protein ACNA78_05600 [Balneolaceae bacterium]
MKQRLIFPLLILFFGLIFTDARAQFEGTITMEVVDHAKSDRQPAIISITASNQRIYIASSERVQPVGGLETDALLIRNDHQDFIFRTAPNEALKVSKADIDGLVQMVQRFQGGFSQQEQPPTFDWENRITETGNTQTILGYTTSELVLTMEDGLTASFWITNSIQIRWGMLIDFWNETGQSLSETAIPIELFLNRTSFPLLVQLFDGSQMVQEVRTMSVDTGPDSSGVLDVAPDTKLLGLTDLMMRMMRQR